MILDYLMIQRCQKDIYDGILDFTFGKKAQLQFWPG